ncbi:hypothetical protein MettiDRAFT_0809 [Methanolobus tindarius DSM 2278]|uniref:Uncharacterized protein n=2 Tax=Methanosarcinaceae TaxID=2206 RepID=W9DQ39_METTI|nr:hypothetical protein MettiDRAFT_0809 [Methanolobus tindarius DSM 2278]
MSEHIMITWLDYQKACFVVGLTCMFVGMFIGELKYNRDGLKKKLSKIMESLE